MTKTAGIVRYQIAQLENYAHEIVEEFDTIEEAESEYERIYSERASATEGYEIVLRGEDGQAYDY